MSTNTVFFFFVFDYAGNDKRFNINRQVERTKTTEEKWKDQLHKQYDTSIKLHEHVEDDKGKGLEHIRKCREAKSRKVKSQNKYKVRKYKGH